MIQASTARVPSKDRAKSLFTLAGLAVLASLLTIFSIVHGRAGGPVSAIWALNALFFVVASKSRRTRWPSLVGAMFLGNLSAYLIAGDPALRALMFAIANVVEVVLMIVALNRRSKVRLFRRSTILRFIGWTFVAVLLSTAVVFAALIVFGEPAKAHWTAVWLAAHTLGLLFFTPMVWALSNRQARLDLRRNVGSMLPDLVLVGAITAAVFAQSRYPLLFLVPPVLVFVAYRRGLAGAAIGLFIVGALGLAFTLGGTGPTRLVDSHVSEQLLVLQGFLVVNALAALTVGSAASEKRRLIERLQRHRASLARRAHKERLLIQQARLAERMSQVGYWTLNPSTGDVYWSPEVYRIHGVTPEAFNPQLGDALQFYPEADRQRVSEILRVGIETKAAWSFEADLQKADGSLIRVRSMAEMQMNDANEVETIFGVFKDVTRDHEMLEKVREQETLYRLLADNSSDVIARFGTDSVFTYLSPSIKPLLGYDPDDLIGKSTSLVVHPDDFERVLSDWRRGLASGRPFSVEYRGVHRDGTIKWLEARPSITRDEDGQILEFIDSVRDVTDRHAREVELAKATEAANEATRAKGAFLSNMSHEIRTPLNGIIGFSDLLSDAQTAEERAHYIARIQGAGQALLHVVNDILDFSKIEAGKMTVERVPYGPAALSAEVVELVRAANASSDLVFTHAVDPDVAAAYVGDPARIRQVLLNLVGNAAKFTRQGAVDVRVAPVDGRLGFIIKDNGPGIAPDKLSRVFEGFSQADESVARTFGGTGLGLSISRSLARLMDGDISLTSVLGEGTVATLLVPWVESDQKPVTAAQSAASLNNASLRVMVVDDVEINREFVEIGLGRAGHNVESHASAESALAALSAGASVDVILMDVQMPGTDGLTATRAIRKMAGAASKLPIIGLTANVLPEQAAACLAAGMDDHFGKPIDMARLVERLAKVSSRRDATAVSAPQAASADPAMDALARRYTAHLHTVAEQLRQLIADGDHPKLAALAHSIAGTAGSLGFGAVSDAAFELEAACRRVADSSGEATSVAGDVENLISAISRLPVGDASR